MDREESVVDPPVQLQCSTAAAGGRLGSARLDLCDRVALEQSTQEVGTLRFKLWKMLIEIYKGSCNPFP